jgi:predicted DsbA family dithiol-disulfide isomerase
MMSRLSIDVWSDIACPWCYIGKRRLEAALARFPHAAEVDVVWHAFELDPSAPRERDPGVSYAARLAKKYGMSVAQAEARIARVVELGAAEGIDFRFDRARSGNTFDAHRVIRFAAARGAQGAVKERLLRAYMTEGEPIGDPATLARLAGDAGLDADEVSAALAGDAYAAEVRRDEREAAEMGIDGVPFFVFGGRYGVSGAQPADLLLRALTQTWDERQAAAAPGAFGDGRAGADPDAAACGPDGCVDADAPVPGAVRARP